MLFYGPPGTGKTSTILCVARKIYGDKFATKNGGNYRNNVLEVGCEKGNSLRSAPDLILGLTRTSSMHPMNEVSKSYVNRSRVSLEFVHSEGELVVRRISLYSSSDPSLQLCIQAHCSGRSRHDDSTSSGCSATRCVYDLPCPPVDDMLTLPFLQSSNSIPRMLDSASSATMSIASFQLFSQDARVFGA